MGTQAGELMVRTIQATGLTYAQLGQALGVSAKTVQRVVAGRSHPMPYHFHTLAAIVHPSDRDLAVRLAAAGGTTLEALGIQQPPRPPAPPRVEPPRPTPARPPLSLEHAETVLCAAADTMDVSPRAIRPALAAAFTRAAALGYTVEELARVFGAPGRSAKEKAG